MGKQVPIIWVDETDSTQEEVRRHIPDYVNLSVTAAEYQTAGRGQRGNTWLSCKGMNLTFSMLLRFGEDGFPPLKASDQFLITRAATLGVTDYLESKRVVSKIKWPNDIYVGKRKICGMLIENILDEGCISCSIVGIGLNVNQIEFPGELANPTSLCMVSGVEYDPRQELPILAGYLVNRFDSILGQPDDDPGKTEYENRLFRKGVFHEYVLCSDGTVFEGRILGVNKDGKLLLEKRKGEHNEFAFKEISYII